MKFILLALFIVFTISLGRTETVNFETTCSQTVFDLIVKKVTEVEEENSYIRSLNRLDSSLSEFSHKKTEKRHLKDFRNLPPVFNQVTDIMTVNYMGRIMKLIQDTEQEDRQITIKQMAFVNLAKEYKKRIPEFMNGCQKILLQNKEKCDSSSNADEKLKNCYSDNSKIIELAKKQSPYFQTDFVSSL